MNPQKQRLEVESLRTDDDDLAVDDTALRKCCQQRIDELGKVAVHRLLVAALQQNVVAIAEHQSAKAIPLRFELPAVAGR